MGVGLGLGSTVIQVSKGLKYVLFLLSFSHSFVKTGRFTPKDLACWYFSFRLACTTAGVFLFVWRAQLLVLFFSFGVHNCWCFACILARTTVDLFCCCFSFFLFKIQTTSPHVDTVPEPRPSASRKVTLPASFFSLCLTSGAILHDLKTHRVLWRCG